MFLERGCDPNSTTSNGTSALHYACSKNHIETVKVLLEHKADPSVRDNYGQTPLHRLFSYFYFDFILNNNLNIKNHKGAASKGNIKIVELLLSIYKASPNLTDVQGNTALYLNFLFLVIKLCLL